MFKIKKSKGGSICGKGDVRLEKKKKYPPTKQCTYSCESCSGCNRQTDIRNQRSTPGHDLRSNSDLLAVSGLREKVEFIPDEIFCRFLSFILKLKILNLYF